MSTYTTFYYENPQWFNNLFSTSSVINQWSEPQYQPKFKIGETIVYYTYLLWSKKLAVHTIVDIKDSLYVFNSPYEEGKQYTMKPEETDKNFMEYNECMDKYPEEFLRATRNGPTED